MRGGCPVVELMWPHIHLVRAWGGSWLVGIRGFVCSAIIYAFLKRRVSARRCWVFAMAALNGFVGYWGLVSLFLLDVDDVGF